MIRVQKKGVLISDDMIAINDKGITPTVNPAVTTNSADMTAWLPLTQEGDNRSLRGFPRCDAKTMLREPVDYSAGRCRLIGLRHVYAMNAPARIAQLHDATPVGVIDVAGCSQNPDLRTDPFVGLVTIRG